MPHSVVTVRRAVLSDRARMLEISSQIWEGEDYVPKLLDAWFADRAGELAVATLDSEVIAFAHRTWLCPGIAWLEGIRADPAWQGHGAGKALTDHFIGAARSEGASRIELSTHNDNKASIHIIEAYGFRRVGTFCYLERPATADSSRTALETSQLRPVTSQQTVEYVKSSDFLALARGRFPRGWRFFPFDYDPQEAVARLEHRWGSWTQDCLTALLCIRQRPDEGDEVTVNFLDGEPQAMRALLEHALDFYSGKKLSMMLPVDKGRYAAAVGPLSESGFTSWSKLEPDVFAYELRFDDEGASVRNA